jgi:ADP-ribose pyrophosphatase YjhB (NUDIX family)
MGKIPEWAERVYEGILFDVYQKDVEQFDGSTKKFERVRWYDVVKALCMVGENILVIEEDQPSKIHKYAGLPWWRLERGEAPLIAIRREVAEETGLQFDTVQALVTLPVKQWSREAYRYYYICKGAVVSGAQKLDEGGEKIIIHHYTFDEFIALVRAQELFVQDISNWVLRNYILPGKEDDLKKLLFS